jgi:hypothetical protein
MQLFVSTLTSNHPLIETLFSLSNQFSKEETKSMPVVLGITDPHLRNGLKYKKGKVDRLIPFLGQEEMKSFLLI